MGECDVSEGVWHMDTAYLPDSGCTEAGQQVGSQVLVGGVGSMGGL